MEEYGRYRRSIGLHSFRIAVDRGSRIKYRDNLWSISSTTPVESWPPEIKLRDSYFHLIICTRQVRVPDFVKFRLIHFNFLVPERYAYLSGTWKMKMAKPKVEGTPTVGLILKKWGLYRRDSLVPTHQLPVPGGKLWMGTKETLLVYRNIMFELNGSRNSETWFPQVKIPISGMIKWKRSKFLPIQLIQTPVLCIFSISSVLLVLNQSKRRVWKWLRLSDLHATLISAHSSGRSWYLFWVRHPVFSIMGRPGRVKSILSCVLLWTFLLLLLLLCCILLLLVDLS